MCGIVGYVGSDEAAEHVLDGLRRLEYRGYDSAGIATLYQGDIHRRRRKGKLLALTQALRKEPLAGTVAIGHTRWATHGRPSDENAHPHRVDDIVLVHNGIIENYLELAEALRLDGAEIVSETDTEIIAHLVAREPGANLRARVEGAVKKLQGAYAIAVLCVSEPHSLVVAKNASPLVLGVCDDAGVLASDIPAILPHTQNILTMEEGEIGIIEAGKIRLWRMDTGEVVDRAPRKISWSPVMAEKDGHRHFMHKEMHEQPRAITDTLRGRLGAHGTDVHLDPQVTVALGEARRVLLTACGTSWHAGHVGRLAIEALARLGTEVELASELRYRDPVLDPDTLIIAVSQSGETADTLEAIKALQARGCPVLALVNVMDSSIARQAHGVVYTHAGPEIGVASTKAFVTQVAALMLIALCMGRQRGLSAEKAQVLMDDLRQIPRHMEKILSQEKRVLKVAQGLVRARSALFLGRGMGFPVALEGALKLKEISYIHAEGYAAGEMKHGPIALIEPEVPVVAVCTRGPLYDKVLSAVQEVRARDGRVIAIATEGDSQIESIADEVLWVPAVEPLLSPLVDTLPLQLLAYHVADLRGTDVDQPRNLAKSVTVE